MTGAEIYVFKSFHTAIPNTQISNTLMTYNVWDSAMK
jgi:hypothetical protein